MTTILKRYGWVIGLIFLLWAATFLLYTSNLGDAQRGHFGDMFGAVNALFSGLAFAFVIIALLQQQKQFERQAFENGFFELLKLFRQNVDALQIPIPNRAEPLEGKLVLGILRSKLEEALRKTKAEADGKYSKDDLKTAYARFYKDQESRLGDYFRLLFHLMQYIKDAKCLDSNERRRFGNMVRAGLNSNELFLLFFNGLSDAGEGSRDYISRFRMFEHLDLGNMKAWIPPALYPPSAFGNRNQEPPPAAAKQKELKK